MDEMHRAGHGKNCGASIPSRRQPLSQHLHVVTNLEIFHNPKNL